MLFGKTTVLQENAFFFFSCGKTRPHREAQEADIAAFVSCCVKSPKIFMRFNAKMRAKFVDFYMNVCYTRFSVYLGRTEHV